MAMHDHTENSEPASKARLRLWLQLLKLSRRIEGELRENLRTGHATTLPRFDVMAALSRSSEGMKMSELSGALRVSNGNVTGIVDRLVDEGFVVRSAVEGDRRASRITLTAQGRDVFDTQAGEHEAWIDDLFDGVSPSEAAALGEQLRQMAEQMDEGGST
jgi:DNA-binding MarR family transcriptional regulator